MRSGRVRVIAAAIAIAISAFAVWAIFLRGVAPYAGSVRLPWWVLAAMFGLTEIHVVHVQLRRETQTFSLNEIPLLLGLFFASPTDIVLAQLVGAAVALIAHRRQPLMKWTYNLAHFCLAAVLASLAFRTLAHPGGLLHPTEIAGSFIATVVAIATGTMAVMLAVSLVEGRPSLRQLGRSLAFGSIGTVTNTCLALMAIALIREDPRTAWLLPVPAVVMFFAYRGYTSYRQQNETLTRLSDTTRTVQRSVDVEPAMRTVLEHARTMFSAELAVITFFPREPGEAATEACLGPESDLESLSLVELNPTEGVWARIAAEGQPILLARPMANARLRAHFASRSMRDAMVAPLWGKDGVIGTVLVGNRLGDVATFRPEDLSLFSAFVNHVGVALENVRLVSQLQQSIGTLIAADRMKDETLATLSHELRTPITSISGFVEMMLDGDGLTEQEHRRFLKVIAGESERLGRLIEDLLTDARLNGGAIRPILTRSSVEDLVERTRNTAPFARRGSIETSFAPGLPALVTDADLVVRIVSNLVHNAAKHSPPASKITIGARTDGDGVVFTVQDEGDGIPEELHERIFQRFFRAEGAHRAGIDGVGLGLSICRRLADVLGGRVLVQRSAPGCGSMFALWVPLRVREPHMTEQRVIDLESADVNG